MKMTMGGVELACAVEDGGGNVYAPSHQPQPCLHMGVLCHQRGILFLRARLAYDDVHGVGGVGWLLILRGRERERRGCGERGGGARR